MAWLKQISKKNPAEYIIYHFPTLSTLWTLSYLILIMIFYDLTVTPIEHHLFHIFRGPQGHKESDTTEATQHFYVPGTVLGLEIHKTRQTPYTHEAFIPGRKGKLTINKQTREVAQSEKYYAEIKNRGIGASMRVQWLTPLSQCKGPRFNPWLGNQTPHTTKSSHTATKKTPHML